MTADYTFVNERLARHYGIPNVYGSHFRRVTLQDETRRGLLGKGAVLMVTSHPNRTSPVLRGKWILENVLGAPPAAAARRGAAVRRGCRRGQAQVRARAHGTASPQSGVRELSPDDRSLLVSRSRTSTRLARGARAMAGPAALWSMPRVSSSTARRSMVSWSCARRCCVSRRLSSGR